MPASRDEDDPYLYPGTKCLQNKLGLRDPALLQQAEANLVARRDAALAMTTLPGAYDLGHLQAFHRYLFRDVYLWAGSLRSCNLTKGPTTFVQMPMLRRGCLNVLSGLPECFTPGLKRQVFVEEATDLLATLNHLHPFREGNGRTQRAFLRQLGAGAGWYIDWSQLDREENVTASTVSVLGSNEPLRALLDDCVRPAV